MMNREALMLKNKYIAAALILTNVGLLFAAPKKMKSDDLSNMLIEGENRLRVKEKAPDDGFAPDKYKDISAMVTDESLLLAFRPPAINEPPIAYPQKLNSHKTATAWL